MQGELNIEFDSEIVGTEVRTLAFMLGESLQLLSPVDSSISIKIGEDCASCEIQSSTITFKAESQKDDAFEALRDLEHQITVQIQNWKARRFKPLRYEDFEGTDSSLTS